MKLFLKILNVLSLMTATAGPVVMAQDAPLFPVESIFQKHGGGSGGEDKMYCRFGEHICECYLNSWGQPQCIGIT